jgi:hypothetical protein
MDISSIGTVNEDDGIVLHLKDINDELMYDGTGDAQTPVTIRHGGTYSKVYRDALAAVVKSNSKVARRGGVLDAETAERAALRVEAACIFEWSFTAGGKPYPITPDNWKALVDKQPQWQDQLRVSMNDHERFSSGS